MICIILTVFLAGIKIQKKISESNLREDINRENIAKKLGIDAVD